MPLDLPPAPEDRALRTCLRRARMRRGPGAWKRFRASRCGKIAFDRLHDAYGGRCVYCDHTPGRTIDHSTPLSVRAAKAYAWENWRLACGDCNRLKGTRLVVDPVRSDPRDFLLFDVVTGAPEVRRDAGTTRSARGEETISALRLDHQIFNDARRRLRIDLVLRLRRLVGKPSDRQRRQVRELLDRSVPHRAVVRELVLEQDDALNPWRGLIVEALSVMPELLDWAHDPKRTGRIPRRRRRTHDRPASGSRG